MAEHTIAKTLSLQPSHAHSRKINILDFFGCVLGEQANNLFTSDPNGDFVGFVEDEPIEVGLAIGGRDPNPNPNVFDIISNDTGGDIGGGNYDFEDILLDEEKVGFDVTIEDTAECTETVYVIVNEQSEESIGLKPLDECLDYVKFSQKVDDRNRIQINRRGIYGKVAISPIYLNGSAELQRTREDRKEDGEGNLVSLKVYEDYLVRLFPISQKIALILINHLSTGFVRINDMPIKEVQLPSKNNDNDGQWIVSMTASVLISERYTSEIKQC